MYQSSKPKNYGGGMIRGGMTTRPQMPKTVRTADGETIQSNVGKPPKVWRSFHGQGRGPIGIKPYNYSFFDLLTNPDDEELRRTSFEDWHFPDVIEEEVDGSKRKFILPQKTIYRGLQRQMADEETQGMLNMSQATVTQYLYIPLNPSLNIVSTFGELPGSLLRRSDYLACVEVGDPRSGRLDNAHLKYVINMAASVENTIQVATTLNEGASYTYLYKIETESEVASEIYNRWFNGTYYFNGVIYLKVRAFMNR